MSKFDDLYRNAINDRPEQFIQPLMPYIKCSINGIELIALIDTGSVITCTNLEIANKCDIISDMDDSYKMPIVGVGNKTSIGKNYGVDIKINNEIITMTMTILDISINDCDLIIGLDLMRSFAANIIFQTNKLTLKSQNKILETDLLTEQEIKLFRLTKNLIEVSHGILSKENAIALLEKNNLDINKCILELL